MRKPIYLLYFILLISEFCISEINSDYGKIYQYPDTETTFLSDKITQLKGGLLVKTGIKANSIPFVKVFASNGLHFTSWELPFDEELSDYLYPMATSCDNEICLFLNNRLEFFLPDGEYLRTVTLKPPIVSDSSRKIIDMNYNSEANQINFLVKNEWQNFFTWYVYLANGVLLSSDKWSETSSSNTTFFTSIENRTFLGINTNNTILLFYKDGSQYIDDTIYNLLDKIYNSLEIIFGKATEFYFLDIEFAKSNVWIQCNKAMLCFDLEGNLLHSPLLFDSKLNNNISGRLNNDTFFCMANNNDLATFHSSGTQQERWFFKKYYKDCNNIICITQDASNNWWAVYQNNSNDSTHTYLSLRTAGGIELNKWEINNSEVPAVFAKKYQEPIALVGNKKVYPLSFFTSLEEKGNPWAHNITSNFNDKISAAVDKNNLVYLLNSIAEDSVHVFSLTGAYVRSFDIEASCLFSSKKGTVITLENSKNYNYYLRVLFENGSMSSRYRIRNKEKWEEKPTAFVQLESGLIVVGLGRKIVFCAPIQKNKIFLSNGLEVKISPRNTQIAIDYSPELNYLSLYGLDCQKKSLRPLYKKLSRYGKKLSKITEDFEKRKKIFKKIISFISKEKSNVSIVFKNKGKSQIAVNINACIGLKNIKMKGINLESLRATKGGKPISIKNISIFKRSNCKVECARLRKLNVKGDFSGKITTWLGDINSINIKGEITKSSFLCRKNIKKLVSDNKISYLTVRTGISPLGFSGFAGDIIYVSSGGNIENCEFIACAVEGNSSNWSNGTAERYNGSILTVKSKIIKTKNKLLPVGEIYNSLFVTKNPIKFIVQKKEETTVIVNGEKQNF